MCNVKECMFKIQDVANKRDLEFINSMIDYYSKHKGELTNKQTEAIRILYKKYLNILIDKEVKNFTYSEQKQYQNINELLHRLLILKNNLKNVFTEKSINIIISKILKNINNDELTTMFFSYKVAGEMRNIGILEALANEYKIEPIKIMEKYFKP